MAASNYIRLDVRGEIDHIKRHVDGMLRELSKQPAVRALNAAGTSMRVTGAREVKKVYTNLSIRKINGYFRLEKARNKSLTVKVAPKGGRLPLTFFSTVQWKTRGGGVSVVMGNEKVFIPHAFIRRRGGNRDAVYIRANDYNGALFNKGQLRTTRVNKSGNDLPIAELFARSIPEVILRNGIDATMVKIGERKFSDEFERQLKLYSDSLAMRLETGNTVVWRKG